MKKFACVIVLAAICLLCVSCTGDKILPNEPYDAGSVL